MDIEDVLVELSVRIESLSREATHKKNNALAGKTREDIFKDLFGKNLLPWRYGIGAGRVVGLHADMSNECDIIFFDRLDCPRFVGDEDAGNYPSLGVHGIVEVKSTLNKRELLDGLEKVAAFKRLYRPNIPMHFGGRYIARQGADPKPFGIVFAYRSKISLDTISSHIAAFDSDHQDDERCELVVVVNDGYVARTFDGINPQVVFGYMEPGKPTVTVRARHLTIPPMYQMLSDLLVSVPTFPVNPAAYTRVAVDVDGVAVAGQVRVIDPNTRAKRTLKRPFLKRVLGLSPHQAPSTLGELESRVFGESMYQPLGHPATNVWLYDPDNRLGELIFEPHLHPRFGEVRRLTSAMFLLHVRNQAVLLPHVYVTDDDVDIVHR